MATKSKNYKALRTISLLLSLVCVCTASFAVCRTALFYNMTGYFFTTKLSYGSFEPQLYKAFLNEVGFAYYAARRVYITYENGKVFEDERLKIHLEEQKDAAVENAVDEYLPGLEKTLRVYNEMKAIEAATGENPMRTYDEYDGFYGYYSENYNMFIRADDVERNDYFYLDENGEYQINRKSIYDYYSSQPEYSYYDIESYENEFKYLKTYLSSYKSLEYLIINSQTGEAFTNSQYKTADDFTDAYSNQYWFVSSNDNFDTAVVGNVFEELSHMTYEYPLMHSDTVKTSDGRFVVNSEYTNKFFNSMHYAYTGYMDNSGSLLLGSLRYIEPSESEVYICFNNNLVPGDPFAGIIDEFNAVASNLSTIITCGIAALALLLVLTAVQLVLAGKATAKLGLQSKVPGELHALVFVGGAVGMGVLAVFCVIQIIQSNAYLYTWQRALLHFGGIGGAAVCYMLFMNWLLTLIRSIKGKVYFRRLLIAQPFRLLNRFIKKIKANRSTLKNGASRQLKIFLPIYLGASAVCWLFIWLAHQLLAPLAGFVLLPLNVGLVFVLYHYARAIDKISEAVLKTQEGDFDVDISRQNVPQPMANLADGISQMRSGMKVAIDSAVREQKAKMDLITNVSHDLKTPLTSIITYSDLIKRSGIADETVDGYADILVEKSFRLKQLIEDLTEATRVSTGSVEINLAQVSLYELVAQALGENAESLESKSIEVRLNDPPENSIVLADGQKTYRVLENIISNIFKYAMPGTRAYVDVSCNAGFGKVSFKNISNSPLNIPPQQLMERFVRGDASRSGEGSGLGLSIARDLCELQGGSFDIQIDGDMFTATVSLPKA